MIYLDRDFLANRPPSFKKSSKRDTQNSQITDKSVEDSMSDSDLSRAEDEEATHDQAPESSDDEGFQSGDDYEENENDKTFEGGFEYNRTQTDANLIDKKIDALKHMDTGLSNSYAASPAKTPKKKTHRPRVESFDNKDLFNRAEELKEPFLTYDQ